MEMGTIVCQHCSSTIGQIEVEKVTTLYGKCNHIDCINQQEKNVVKVK
ncbi:GapA-binding peptide SR1P [Metabacillus litoralis]